MYVLSFRELDRADGGAVLPAQVYHLDGVDPAYAWNPGGPSRLKRVFDPQAFGRDVRGAHVCFIVHGFNVNRDRGYTGCGAMAQEMMGLGPLRTLPGGAAVDLLTRDVTFFVPVLWPGDWLLPINYPVVLPIAREAAGYFAEFLTGPSATMSRVSFFTHSFGARVVLETVQKTLRRAAGRVGRHQAPPRFERAVLTAAAAPGTVLDSPYYADAVAAFGKIDVVSAETDAVLTGAFPIGNLVEQALWRDDAGPDFAMGRNGPVLRDGSPARGKTCWYVATDAGPNLRQGHGDYLPAPWDPAPPLPNGWSQKRENISRLTQAAFENRPPPWPARRKIPSS